MARRKRTRRKVDELNDRIQSILEKHNMDECSWGKLQRILNEENRAADEGYEWYDMYTRFFRDNLIKGGFKKIKGKRTYWWVRRVAS